MKTFKQYLQESRKDYDEDHPDPKYHENEFNRRVNSSWPNGVIAYHEAPGHHAESFNKHGIEGEYGIFATIGQPSNFVTSKKKTIVRFRVPKHYHIQPDMRYDPNNPHKDLLKQHSNLFGADININVENIHPKHIIDVKEVDDKK